MEKVSYRKGITAALAVIVFIAFITTFDKAGFIAMVALLGAIGTVLFYSLVRQMFEIRGRTMYRVRSKDALLKLLATIMGFFLIVGTLLYIYVFWTIRRDSVFTDEFDHQVNFNNAEFFLRSLICSLDLFMLDVDSNILDRLDGHSMLKAWISIQAALSFSCTVLMLIGLVYSRLHAHYKLIYKTKIDERHNHLYLFFGENTPTEALIKDIRQKDPYAVIVLIDEANIKEDDTDEWDSIVGYLTHKRKTFSLANRYDAAVTIAGTRLSDIDSEITSSPDFDAFNYLGITRVGKMINKLRDVRGAELHIFLLDDNEERNIRDFKNLSKDRTILSVAQDEKLKHTIYCHARYNGPNRVMEDVAIKNGLNIKIIDSSHLAIERIKLDRECHPIQVMDLDQKNIGTVSESFDSLIVGFGEVGRDAFRFLYEFGAFVGNDATLDVARRSPFNCTIVDKSMTDVLGNFKSSMPGVFMTPQDKCNIKFREIDYNSDKFHSEILTDEYLRKLNYVVISIGNNDEAISLGCRIFSRFRQAGGDLSKLIILVRCTDDSKVEIMQDIADHYNYGYGRKRENRPVIRIFGQPEATYTYELVVSDKLLRMGKAFHEHYRIVKGENETWDMRHNKLFKSDCPEIDDLRKLRRKESQDLSNALHVKTKITVLQRCMPATTNWPLYESRYFKGENTPDVEGKGSGITYPGLSKEENLIILRLAMLEHIRWNAAHELLGYQRREDGEPECDEMTMRHNCLKRWHELDAESKLTENTAYPSDYKAYDFAVIDTTLALSFGPKVGFLPV